MIAFLQDLAAAQGPALFTVLPLIMAACVAVLPTRTATGERLAWLLTALTTGLCILLALDMLTQVTQSGEAIHYAMGGWVPPLGIGYLIDGLNAPVLLLISAFGFICTLYALPSVGAEIEPKKRAAFYAAFLVSFAGLLGIVVTNDAFNVFVFLEVSSISTYVLVAMGASRDRRALTSSFHYLIMGSLGATFFVIGIGFLYMQTGTLNMIDMARLLGENGVDSRVTHLAFAFIVIGLGLKLAMFPLHSWLPGAYAYAPSFITAFLAATATKAALYLLLRFTFTVFDPSWEFVSASLTYLITGLAIAGMVFASLKAIYQNDIRRLLAFSSVAQVGYILLGIGIATGLGMSAGYLHLLNHAIIKGALFIAVGAFWYRFGITHVADMRGLGKAMPWTMAGFTLAGLSLIGVPGTAGFVSKLALVRAAAEHDWWWAVAVILFTSILAILYVGKMIEQAYLAPPPEKKSDALKKNEAPLTMLIPLWVLVIASIWFGIDAEWPIALADMAAQVMQDGPHNGPLPFIQTSPGGH